MNLLIHNVTIFTNDDSNRVLERHAVAIEGSRIKEVGPEPELKRQYEHYQRIDGKGKLLMPGLVNAHMHFYSTFARGLRLQQTPKNFAEILSMLWWKLDSSLDEEAVYYSALVPAIGAIKHGVSAVIDHHASPNAVSGSLDRIEEALRQVGMRAVLCYEVSDRDGPEIRELGLEENLRYIKKCQEQKAQNPDHLFDGMVGLHASFTLENQSLQRAAEIMQKFHRGAHIHVLEDHVDREQTRQKYGMEVGARLHEFGILGEKTITAHGIYLTEAEMDLLAQTNTMLVHNPQSNMNNAVGRTDIFKLIDRGILVGLGTDGMTPDIKAEVRTGYLMHKHHLKNSNVGLAEFMQMTLKNNPEIFYRVSNQKVGRIEPGYLADLILVDYYPPTDMTAENFWGHFIFGMCDAVVDATIINGQIVMQNKQLTKIDEEHIAEEATRCAKRVWEKFSK